MHCAGQRMTPGMIRQCSVAYAALTAEEKLKYVELGKAGPLTLEKTT